MRYEEYTILGKTFHRYQYSVLQLCERLHMYLNCSMEWYDPIGPYVTYKYLIHRKANWRVSRCSFDDHVWALMSAVIDEYESNNSPHNSPTEKDAIRYLDKFPDVSIEPMGKCRQ